MITKNKTQVSLKNYFNELLDMFHKIKVTNSSNVELNLDVAIHRVVKKILAKKNKDNKVIIIGNGGSASIASHIATDFLKNAKVPAMTFNDSSLITCLSNDLGYAYVFQKPIELLARKGDILFAISSSGKSKNILNATKEAKRKGCFLITLSGFAKKNPLRKLGDLNFYLPSGSYGFVEIAHLAICHCIADKVIEKNK